MTIITGSREETVTSSYGEQGRLVTERQAKDVITDDSRKSAYIRRLTQVINKLLGITKPPSAGQPTVSTSRMQPSTASSSRMTSAGKPTPSTSGESGPNPLKSILKRTGSAPPSTSYAPGPCSRPTPSEAQASAPPKQNLRQTFSEPPTPKPERKPSLLRRLFSTKKKRPSDEKK